MREQSKENWNSNSTIQEINAGSFQRIADAAELMASNYLKLQRDLDMYKRLYEEENKEKKIAYRRNIALRGYITRLKKMQGL